MGKTIKEYSKTLVTFDDHKISINSDFHLNVIQTGALQRIAESIEFLTADRVKLESELKWYKQNYQLKRNECIDLKRSISGFKAWNTRLRNQIKKLKL